MTILSWNIQHGGGTRVPRIVEELSAYDPYVVPLASRSRSVVAGRFRGCAVSLRPFFALLPLMRFLLSFQRGAFFRCTFLQCCSRFVLLTISGQYGHPTFTLGSAGPVGRLRRTFLESFFPDGARAGLRREYSGRPGEHYELPSADRFHLPSFDSECDAQRALHGSRLTVSGSELPKLTVELGGRPGRSE